MGRAEELLTFLEPHFVHGREGESSCRVWWHTASNVSTEEAEAGGRRHQS